MNEGYIYSKMKAGEETEVSRMVETVFSKFVAPDFNKMGINEFMRYIQPAYILNRALFRSSFFITAKYNGKIVGLIEMKNNDHISLLFVDENHHNKGIAKSLFKQALLISLARDKNITEITVNASPYAVKIYKQMGFKAEGVEKEVNGVIFCPMKFVLGGLATYKLSEE